MSWRFNFVNGLIGGVSAASVLLLFAYGGRDLQYVAVGVLFGVFASALFVVSGTREEKL